MANSTPTRVHALRAEHQSCPVGIDATRPSLSWQITDSPRATLQTGYQVVVGESAQSIQALNDVVWDSGRVDSDRSIGVSYGGPALKSRTRYYWSVRVWTDGPDGTPTEWAEPAYWEMGLLHVDDWCAKWIEPVQRPTQPQPPVAHAEGEDVAHMTGGNTDLTLLNPALLIRRVFTTDRLVERARLYATAHGVYELELNGDRVGDRQLAPEYTAYDKYLMYQTYNVTDLLRDGENVIGATVADGWYAGRLGMMGESINWGDRLGLLLQLEITYSDGSTKIVASDETFTSSSGSVRYADLLVGERYDARLEQPGWSSPGFDASDWTAVEVADHSLDVLVAQHGEPLRVVAEVPAQAVLRSPTGETIVDFGQNVVGHVRLEVAGENGTEITLAHTQTLDADGNYMSNILGVANDNTDVFVLRGGGTETFEPTLTYHSFRYVRVHGYPGDIAPEQLTAVVVSSVAEADGQFRTGNADLNRIHSNVEWTLRSNLFSIPAESPDRERAGFTGDFQVVAPTAVQMFACRALVERWFRNLVAEQFENGLVPLIVPYQKAYREMYDTVKLTPTAAGWGDAAVTAPWTAYRAYGDARILEETYAAGVKWLDYVSVAAAASLSPDDAEDDDLKHLWRNEPDQELRDNGGFNFLQFGDWLTPSKATLDKFGFYTIEDAAAVARLVPTMFYAHSADLLGKMAEVLGKDAESRTYADRAAAIRRGFRKAFVGEDGLLIEDVQGMYVLALQFNLVGDDLRPGFARRLGQLIRKNDGRLDTGLLSSGFALPVLSEHGLDDIAYDVIFGDRAPSWLYQVRKGATTMWEMWDAVDEAGASAMVSHNFPGFATVGDWLFRFVGGIRSDAPGYKQIRIDPRMDKRVGFAETRLETPYGPVATRWELEDGERRLDVEIPPNTTATIRLPDDANRVTEGERDVFTSPHISVVSTHSGVELKVGSGSYRFNL